MTTVMSRALNCVVDALTRIETNAIQTDQQPNIDFAAIAEKQQADPEHTAMYGHM